MKNKLVKIALALVVLLVIAVVAISLSLGSIIKKGVETFGPKATKVDVKLGGVNLSLLSGKAGLSDLFVGNPEGFKAPALLKAGEVSVAVQPMSVLSDKVIVRSVVVKAPEITIEGSLAGGKLNLNKLQANIDEFVKNELGVTAGDKKSAPADKKAGKKLQVDEFEFSGGKINLALTELGGRSATIPLPTVKLSQLGQGPEGITPGELAQKVTKELLVSTTKAIEGNMKELLKNVAGAAKEVTKDAAKSVKDVTKGVTDLFKKK